MAGGKSQAFQQDVLENIFGYSTTLVTSTDAWIHLYNTTLNDANTPATTGRVGSTAAGDNYNPVAVVLTTDEWLAPTAADPSVTQNINEISFTTSASTGWGTVQAVQVTSSSGTGGVSLYWGDLTTNQTVSAGNVVKFSTGALQLKET